MLTLTEETCLHVHLRQAPRQLQDQLSHHQAPRQLQEQLSHHCATQQCQHQIQLLSPKKISTQLHKDPTIIGYLHNVSQVKKSAKGSD